MCWGVIAGEWLVSLTSWVTWCQPHSEHCPYWACVKLYLTLSRTFRSVNQMGTHRCLMCKFQASILLILSFVISQLFLLSYVTSALHLLFLPSFLIYKTGALMNKNTTFLRVVTKIKYINRSNLHRRVPYTQ